MVSVVDFLHTGCVLLGVFGPDFGSWNRAFNLAARTIGNGIAYDKDFSSAVRVLFRVFVLLVGVSAALFAFFGLFQPWLRVDALTACCSVAFDNLEVQVGARRLTGTAHISNVLALSNFVAGLDLDLTRFFVTVHGLNFLTVDVVFHDNPAAESLHARVLGLDNATICESVNRSSTRACDVLA